MKKKILSIVAGLALTVGFCSVVTAEGEEILSVANLIKDKRVEQLGTVQK